MTFAKSIIEKSILKKRDVVFPESNDERILKATSILIRKKIASRVILLGDKNKIIKDAKSFSIEKELQSSHVEIINPLTSEKKDVYASILFEKRKNKGMSLEQAQNSIKNSLYYAAMMVDQGDVHSMVAGAITTTADVLRIAFRIIGSKKNTPLISSFFIMEYKDKNTNNSNQILFADCAIVPKPNSQELAHIAISTAQSCKSILGVLPKVAMLSFSTKGSALHEETQKVADSVNIAKKLAPSLHIDGEIQFDTAFNVKIGKLKSPNSPIAGKANVFIFPNLNAGNIGYKIAQQLGDVQAYGPFIQGIAKPISDLSRGCSVDDVVVASATMMCV